MNEVKGPVCAFVDCGIPAVGSRAVRGTLWFATHSRMTPSNGEKSRWEVGGYVEPVSVLVTIHVCAAHNYVAQEVTHLD